MEKHRQIEDKDFYIERNRLTAIEVYGDQLDEKRRVPGTTIWFDWLWRYHDGPYKGN